MAFNFDLKLWVSLVCLTASGILFQALMVDM